MSEKDKDWILMKNALRSAAVNDSGRDKRLATTRHYTVYVYSIVAVIKIIG